MILPSPAKVFGNEYQVCKKIKVQIKNLSRKGPISVNSVNLWNNHLYKLSIELKVPVN